MDIKTSESRDAFDGEILMEGKYMKQSTDRFLSRMLFLISLPLCCLVVAVSCDSGVPDNSAAISLKPHTKKPVVFTKVPLTDSRVVRGFRGTPVDGTLQSIEFRGYVSEYPDTLSEGFDASSGVDYDYTTTTAFISHSEITAGSTLLLSVAGQLRGCIRMYHRSSNLKLPARHVNSKAADLRRLSTSGNV